MAGYSGTPLAKKLGLKDGFRVVFSGAPDSFEPDLGPLPESIKKLTARAKELDLVIVFSKRAAALKRDFAKLAAKLVKNGMIWVAWPKKSSGVATDLAFDVVQKIGLDAGLVDVKICAVDETWSGLKFVIRKQDR